MKQTNPIKRVLSCILASAMVLSLAPPLETVIAAGIVTQNAFNAGSYKSPPGDTPSGGDGKDWTTSSDDDRFSIKVSMFWAPRADDWGITNPAYLWEDKSVQVIDGAFLYEGSIPDYTNSATGGTIGATAYPNAWSAGSATGYQLDTYTGYDEVGRHLADGDTFYYANKAETSQEYIAASLAAWWVLTEDWGVDNPLAQGYSETPKMFLELEEWRTRLFNPYWDTSILDSNNQFIDADAVNVSYERVRQLAGGKWEMAGHIYGLPAGAKYIDSATSGFYLPSNLFAATKYKDAAIEAGYHVGSDLDYAKSYYTSPFIINQLVDLVLSRDGSNFLNPDVLAKSIQTGQLLTGELCYTDGTVEYGQYKLVIEPIQNRTYAGEQAAFSFKDMLYQKLSGIEDNGITRGGGLATDAADYYKFMAESFQLETADEALKVYSLEPQALTDKYARDATDIYNQYGMWVFTLPAVPVGYVDPLPTLVKTYVKVVDWVDGEPEYVTIAETTENATLSMKGWEYPYIQYKDEEHGTQTPDFKVIEQVKGMIPDDEGNYPTYTAYLNDVITTSHNIVSDPETTSWWEWQVPVGFTLDDEPFSIEESSEDVTSYHFDMIFESDHFTDVTDMESLAEAFTTMAEFLENRSTLILSESDGVRYTDKSESVSATTSIDGSQFLDQVRLGDLHMGYFKQADSEIYQVTPRTTTDETEEAEEYYPNETVNSLIGYDMEENYIENYNVLGEALTGGESLSQGFIVDDGNDPSDSNIVDPEANRGSNVVVLRYVVGNEYNPPNERNVIKLIYEQLEGEPIIEYIEEAPKPLEYDLETDEACAEGLSQSTLDRVAALTDAEPEQTGASTRLEPDPMLSMLDESHEAVTEKGLAPQTDTGWYKPDVPLCKAPENWYPNVGTIIPYDTDKEDDDVPDLYISWEVTIPPTEEPPPPVYDETDPGEMIVPEWDLSKHFYFF